MGIKKYILAYSGFISSLLVIVDFQGTYKLCFNVQTCVDILYFLFLEFLISIPLFLFSLITYFLPERFFITWLKFARVWIPLSMLGILLAPEYSNEFMFAITKGSVAFTMSVLFCVISSAILLFKLFQDEKPNRLL